RFWICLPSSTDTSPWRSTARSWGKISSAMNWRTASTSMVCSSVGVNSNGMMGLSSRRWGAEDNRPAVPQDRWPGRRRLVDRSFNEAWVIAIETLIWSSYPHIITYSFLSIAGTDGASGSQGIAPCAADRGDDRFVGQARLLRIHPRRRRPGGAALP